MYPTPPHPAWSHSQPPPPPPPTMHSPHPSWQGHSTMYHYGPPHPPPPPTSAPPPHHPHHLRYPQPPPHHHRHAPRSRQPVYYHSRHPSPPPIATNSRTIHPALVTPQTPQGPPPPPPLPRAPPSSKAPATPSSLPVTHDPNARDPDMACSSNQHLVTTKPPRPYTEYTMFYQLEREYILHRLLVDKNDPQAALDQEQQTQEALFKNDPLMPQRYRTLPLRADWYISGKSKKPSKRKHRKTHGKIGFLELTRMIAARWANVDDETRKYCKMMAAMELVKYKEDVESYNLYKARLEKMGEVPEDVKEKERKKRAKDKKAREKSDALLVESTGAITALAVAVAGGNARNIKADSVRSDEALSSSSLSSSKQLRDDCQDNVDNDMEQFITSLVHDDHPVQEEDRQRRDRKRSLSHLPPPLPPSNSTQLYREDHHTTSHYEAPWNHFMPGPREDRRGTMPMHPPPPVVRAQDAASSSKIITPERSSKRRRLPVHRNAHHHGSTGAAYGAQSHPLDAAAMIHSGPVSPNEDELIHMTFSGIDESEIAREFYFPSHATDSGDVAETASLQEASMSEEASHPQTEALYGPPLQSFDYWDALMEPTTLQRGGGGGGGGGSERL